MTICKICDKEVKSCMALSKHVAYGHHMNVQEYYDKFILDHSLVCPVCGGTITNFINLGKGYTRTCTKKCSAILARTELRKDSDKFARFKSNVTDNMVKFHTTMSSSLKEERSEKISTTLKDYAASMSDEERKEKYGWLNKITDEEERNKIIGRMTSHTKVRHEVTFEEALTILSKRRQLNYPKLEQGLNLLEMNHG